ncbi:MAG TPA: hypothetical protein VHY58_09715 [Streptosporangiaceae bacterium]|jgi:hypothetical protein|nr:hypothetical protein [Streptosporangiaceae bacterium]
MSEEDVAAALRELLQIVDQVPEAALSAANATIGWRDLDADLASLAAEYGPELAHLRGGQARLLTFHSERTIIELEVSAERGKARLLGQLDPPREVDVTVQTAGPPRTTRTDHRGRFTVTELSDGWVRLVISDAGQPAGRTMTEWFRV